MSLSFDQMPPELAQEQAHGVYMEMAGCTLGVTPQQPFTWFQIILVRFLLKI